MPNYIIPLDKRIGLDQKLNMAKKKTKRRHQSFKMTPHKHPNERVFIYIVVAVAISIAVGYFLKDQTAAVLGLSSSY